MNPKEDWTWIREILTDEESVSRFHVIMTGIDNRWDAWKAGRDLVISYGCFGLIANVKYVKKRDKR